MIPFNKPPVTGREIEFITEVIKKKELCGDGEFTKQCNSWLEQNIGGAGALLVTSCTHALEMAAFLCRIIPGDEVIMPSYTFTSTANAFVLRGAKIVFVDIRPDTMNIDENLIEAAITERTKVIVPVHYAGVACEMDKINEIADRYKLLIVEDAAQAIMSKYKGIPCGGIGNFGCFSFHETKNLSCGEGGAIIIKDKKDIDNAEILREKGTNRSKFWRGEIDKYSWINHGSSYLPSELNAAYLFAQMELSRKIMENRTDIWNYYLNALIPLQLRGQIELPCVPAECEHNAHMFYIKTKDLSERTKLIEFLKMNGVHTVFHYVPLHSSAAGRKFSQFFGEDRYTTKESERLLRLPLYYGMTREESEIVTNAILAYYSKTRA